MLICVSEQTERGKFMIIQPKPLEYFVRSATLVIDTNVLLQAYQWRGADIENTLEQLEWFAKHGRLIIPSQVVIEFKRRREGLIKTVENSLNNVIKNLDEIKIGPGKALHEICPVFNQTDDFKEAVKLKELVTNDLTTYKEMLDSIRVKVSSLFDRDQILERIQALIDKCYFLPIDLGTNEELEKEAKRRSDNNLPPGYKDKAKGKGDSDSDPSGDYKVWAHILKLKKDVLFITYDEKVDWFMRGSQGRPLVSRPELTKEFSDVTGYQFRAISAKSLGTLQEFPDKLQMDILQVLGNKYAIEDVYDKSKELSSILIQSIENRGIFHIMDDVKRINSNFVKNTEYSFAELCLSYVEGMIDKEELKPVMDYAFDSLQDLWDRRFD